MTWRCDKCGIHVYDTFHNCPYDYHLPYPSPYDNPIPYSNLPGTCINCGQNIQTSSGFIMYHECPKFYCKNCDIQFSGFHRCPRKDPEIEDIKNRLKNIEDLLREKLK